MIFVVISTYKDSLSCMISQLVVKL